MANDVLFTIPAHEQPWPLNHLYVYLDAHPPIDHFKLGVDIRLTEQQAWPLHARQIFAAQSSLRYFSKFPYLSS